MSLKVTFELADADLDHFRHVMKQARAAAKDREPHEILAAADAVLAGIEERNVPDFIGDRLRRLKTLIEMVRDDEWALPDEERSRVLNALGYFAEAEDVIPDDVPGFGFLDDAIMVELVVRELRHEIESYQDFCKFRAANDTADADPDTRIEWLTARRQALHSRMRNRRRKDRARRRSGSSSSRRSPFSLF